MAKKQKSKTFAENYNTLNQKLENMSPDKFLEIAYNQDSFLDFQKESWGDKTTKNLKSVQDAAIAFSVKNRSTELGDYLREGLSNESTRNTFKNNLVSSLGSSAYDNALTAHLNPEEVHDWRSTSNIWKPRFSSMKDNKFTKLNYSQDSTELYVRPYVPKKTNQPLPKNPIPTPGPASNATPSSPTEEGKTVWESTKDWYKAKQEIRAEKEAKYLASKYDSATKEQDKVREDQIKSILRDSSNANERLDKLSFDRLLMEDELHISNEKMERLSRINTAKLSGHLTETGSRFLDYNQLERSLDYAVNETRKDSGKDLHTFGIKSGWSHSAKQAAAASRGERMATFFRLANPVGASSREILSSNLGRMTSDIKIQNAKNGAIGRLVGRAGVAGGAVLTGAFALQSDNPLNEFMATTALSVGGQYGWRAGKALGSMAMYGGEVKGVGSFLGRHAARTVVGGAAAATIGAIGYGAFKLQTDLTSNESNVVQTIKNFTTRENSVFTQDSQQTLTMRQQALQKLSSSALNNRGQLLGSEAEVLRGSFNG